MKEMTLRIRGENEVRRMLRVGKRVAPSGELPADVLEDEDSDQPDVGGFEDDLLTAADVVDEDGNDAASVASAGSDTSYTSARNAIVRFAADTKLPTVIEDSEDDVIDLLSD